MNLLFTADNTEEYLNLFKGVTPHTAYLFRVLAIAPGLWRAAERIFDLWQSDEDGKIGNCTPSSSSSKCQGTCVCSPSLSLPDPLPRSTACYFPRGPPSSWGQPCFKVSDMLVNILPPLSDKSANLKPPSQLKEAPHYLQSGAVLKSPINQVFHHCPRASPLLFWISSVRLTPMLCMNKIYHHGHCRWLRLSHVCVQHKEHTHMHTPSSISAYGTLGNEFRYFGNLSFWESDCDSL